MKSFKINSSTNIQDHISTTNTTSNNTNTTSNNNNTTDEKHSAIATALQWDDGSLHRHKSTQGGSVHSTTLSSPDKTTSTSNSSLFSVFNNHVANTFVISHMINDMSNSIGTFSRIFINTENYYTACLASSSNLSGLIREKVKMS